MTEENKPGNLENLLRYQYGSIAGQKELLENPGTPHMVGALENLARDMSIKGSDNEGWYKGAMSSAEGMKTTAMTYAEKYKKAYDSSSVEDLFSYYSDAKDFKLSQYFSEGEIAIIKAKLSTLKGKTIKELQEGLKANAEMLKKISKGESASEDDIKSATLNKTMYEQALKIIGSLEAMKTESLMLSAYSVGTKQDLKAQKDQLMKYLIG